MMNLLIRDKLLEILHSAYPDLFNKYKKFMVTTEPRETKMTSNYDFNSKTIKINTLSRTPDDILLSGICELAKHIDIINREETHLDRECCVILKKLMIEAVNTNSIKQESLKKYSDRTLKDKIQYYFHNFDYWKFDIKVNPQYTFIFVFESFMIKNILKTNGYTYDPQQALWFKRIYANEFLEENAFTEEYKNKAIFKIIGDNSFFIRPVYLIKLKTFAKSEAKLLRALEYHYDSQKKYWKKIIVASEVEQEINNISNIPRQSLIITRNT